jgi:serine/threonine-protein kinase
MSVAYSATRAVDGKRVVVKMMRAVDEELCKVAKEEYDLLRGLSHPNIIQAIDFVANPSCIALVLDAYDGCNLEEAVRKEPDQHLRCDVSVRLFVKLLSAVSYLHEMHVIHRDVKAANILVSGDMRDLMLIDFNTARRVLSDMALTATGTPEYVSPEVISGEPPSQTHDVWTLGLCLHVMLVGRLPKRSSAGIWNSGEELIGQFVCHEQTPEADMCRDWLACCLKTDHLLRPTAPELLASAPAWLANLCSGS